MQAEPPPPQPTPDTEAVESRGARLRRHGHRTRLFAGLTALAAGYGIEILGPPGSPA